jgi:hypothetical protein
MMTEFSLRDYWRMAGARGWGYPVRYFFQSHLFDILRGTNTHFWTPPQDYRRVGPANADAVHYVACPTRSIVKALEAIEGHAGERFREFRFIDLGCGKGKTLLVYAERTRSMPVKTALGVEIVSTLSSIAQRNAKLVGLEEKIEVVAADAATWKELCPDTSVILFLYNPFGRATLAQVLRHTSGMECYVAYIDPEHASLLEEGGWNRIFRETGKYLNDCIEVWYRSK